jgi:hypothetical protein
LYQSYTLKASKTTLSLNLQDRLVERLNTGFTDDEQRWYVANLYMYMNYHPTNDYPINLENNWICQQGKCYENHKKQLYRR